jgi:hypothetical protein
MNRPFPNNNFAMGVLMGVSITIGIGMVHGPAPVPQITELSQVFLNVDTRPVPPRDEILNVRPWPNPNQCVFEPWESVDALPPFLWHDVDIPTLPSVKSAPTVTPPL